MYILLGIGVAFCQASNVYFLQQLVDRVLAQPLLLMVGYASTLFLSPLMAYLSEYPFNQLQQGIFYFLKQQALEKMSTIDYLTYLQYSYGELLQKIEVGATAGRTIYLQFYCQLLRELLPEIVFTLFFITFIDKKLIPFILLGYLVIFLFTKLLLKLLQALKESTLTFEEELNTKLVRGITDLLVFRINRKYPKEIAAYKETAEKATNVTTKMALIHESFFTCFAISVVLLKIVVVVLFFTQKLSLTMGSFIALLAYMDKIYQPIAIFNVLFVQYRLDKLAYSRLLAILREKDDPKLTKADVWQEEIHALSLENVSFSIGEKSLLSDISMRFEKNKIYGLIGKSGSGKSTVLKLLLGLFQPTEGMVKVNHWVLAKCNIASIYERVFYLSQEAPIFEGTLRENIVLDRLVDEQEIEDVLAKCQLTAFYQKLPDKLTTKIGANGVNLSGGEKQRLAFARLFFSNVEVILLDEATSALDSQTEKLLMNEVKTLFPQKIVIMVTHKDSDLALVDEIVTLDKGIESK
nr:ABC transporter ATP-binding protein [Enterococcus sp. DIV2402]